MDWGRAGFFYQNAAQPVSFVRLGGKVVMFVVYHGEVPVGVLAEFKPVGQRVGEVRFSPPRLRKQSPFRSLRLATRRVAGEEKQRRAA